LPASFRTLGAVGDTAPQQAEDRLAALANFRDGSPERFVPGILAGQLIEVEHLARYRWALQFAPGRRVLDAGCGAGYGSALLAAAGAGGVIGVDAAQSVIDEIAGDAPEGVHFRVGDVCALDFPDDSFELIVCFETIEHVERPEAALAEFARLLSSDGLLVISTPERRASGGVNPHHIRELTREELDEALRHHFPDVALFKQDAVLSSTIVPEAGLSEADADAAKVRVLTQAEAGIPTYLIGLAAAGALPQASPFVGITTRLDFTTWQNALEGAAERSARLQRRIEELEDRLVGHIELQDRLVAAEQRLAEHAELERLTVELRRELDDQDDEREVELRVLRERVERADHLWRDVQASPSWRLTKPLRSFKNLMRG
jgi:SAM-dependent methyltransferase